MPTKRLHTVDAAASRRAADTAHQRAADHHRGLQAHTPPYQLLPTLAEQKSTARLPVGRPPAGGRGDPAGGSCARPCLHAHATAQRRRHPRSQPAFNVLRRPTDDDSVESGLDDDDDDAGISDEVETTKSEIASDLLEELEAARRARTLALSGGVPRWAMAGLRNCITTNRSPTGELMKTVRKALGDMPLEGRFNQMSDMLATFQRQVIDLAAAAKTAPKISATSAAGTAADGNTRERGRSSSVPRQQAQEQSHGAGNSNTGATGGSGKR